MNIYKKIEEIRKKPEHIRERYVWAMVSITMFVVLIIWFFSIKVELSKRENVESITSGNDLVEQLKDTKNSIKDLKEITNQVQGVLDENKEAEIRTENSNINVQQNQ